MIQKLSYVNLYMLADHAGNRIYNYPNYRSVLTNMTKKSTEDIYPLKPEKYPSIYLTSQNGAKSH